MTAMEMVLETIKKTGKALRTGDIVKLSGLEKNEVEKAMKELKSKDKIFSPQKCFWQAK
jgi:prophage antirepressor-like protein